MGEYRPENLGNIQKSIKPAVVYCLKQKAALMGTESYFLVYIREDG